MKEKTKSTLIAIAVPVVYALILRIVCGSENFISVMSISFLFASPVIVGVLAMYLSKIDRVRDVRYRVFFPWIIIGIFFGITILINLEGWACWVMILPVFLIASSLGGVIGAYFRIRNTDKKNSGKLYISLFVLLPLLAAPIEKMIGTNSKIFTADTYITIDAPKEKIWSNITRVREIKEEEDKGTLTNFLSFPRPIKAELNYEGVGANREAIFTKGLVFHELVTEYEHQKRMAFTIKAYPYEIPSTTMDKHIVIGGDYIDVLNGTYELEQINEKLYRIHLYSHFKLSTTFNFYAGWWAKWIMKDIQNNILQVIKNRAES